MIDNAYPSVSVSEYGWLQCDHSAETAIRNMTQRNGVVVAVRQCLVCGANLGAIKKSSPEVMRLATIEPFDEQIAVDWRGQCDLFREQRALREQAQRHAAYSAYLLTPAWRKKRAQVLLRCDGICEGCGEKRAVHVHHLTYEHLGDELLWELKAVCVSCHQKCHPDKELRYE